MVNERTELAGTPEEGHEVTVDSSARQRAVHPPGLALGSSWTLAFRWLDGLLNVVLVVRNLNLLALGWI
jgi:hypothetical protein